MSPAAPPAPAPAREPGARFSQLADLVLTSDDADQSIRWRPGERLHQLFEQRCDQLRAAGDAGHLAVAGGPLAVGYDELERRANRLARFLRSRGVLPGDRVALLFDEPLPAYAGMLATSKINAAYVPLDVAFPADRLAYIVDDARVGVVLTLSHLRDRLADARAEVLCLDEEQAGIDRLPPDRLVPAAAGTPAEDLCYIIYTSGTTGRPKGVAIDHASICNFVRVAAEVYGLAPGDRMYQGMTIAFDFSVEEIWVPLCVGATLVPRPGRTLLGTDLADFLRTQRVSALCCVPTLLATMDDTLPELRFLLVSGETCPQDLVARWHRPGRRFLNVYGPTEATVTATWTTLAPDQPVTIGVPLPTYSVLILDERDQTPLPPGRLGEIGVAGIGLSAGYVNRDDLTARAFLPDRAGIPNNPSGRIYRTGDLGRITADGRIECLGRIDTQVKIRGYRIELTEIESLLLRMPGVAQAVVDTHEPAPGVVELAAYYTERRPGPPVDVDAVYDELRRRLPPYMVPAYLERLDRMPMLPSDKVDRKRLPAPRGTRRLAVRGERAAPDGALERAMAEAVAELLGLDQVSVTSNFFDELTMSSLLVARLCASLRERPELPAITTKDVYLNPTVRALAAAVREHAPRRAVAGRRALRMAPTFQHLRCGALQAGFVIGGLYLAAFLLATGYAWHQAATGPLDGYLRAAAFGSGLFLLATALPLVAKWVLIGRWKPTVIPIWSLAYFRFWVVRALLRISPMALFSGSPLYVLHLRLLGAKVGRGATVFSRATPLCADLLTIGEHAVVRKDAVLPGYRAESGWIRTGRVDIGAYAVVGDGSVLDIDTSLGDHAQLGHASTLRAGQSVPPGRRYHGSPAQDTPTNFALVPPRRCGTRRRFGYGLFQLAVLALVSAPLASAALFVGVPLGYRSLTATVPLLPGMADPQAWIAPRFYLGYLLLAAAAGLVATVLGLLLILTVPRLLHRFVPAGPTFHLYGLRWACHRAIGRLSNSAFFNDLLGDSSFIVHFLRAVGYQLRPLHQTGSNFGLAVRHDSPVHSRVGTETLVSDGLTIANGEYSSSSFTLAGTVIGARNFIGNNVIYPAHGRTGDNVLLATKVMVPIDGPVRANTGLLGSPAFEIPRSVARDGTHDRYRQGPEFAARLARKNRSNLLTMGAFLLQRVLLGYATILVALAAIPRVEPYGLTAYVAGLLAILAFGTVFSILIEHAAMGFRRLRPRFCSIYEPYYWRHERLWKLSRISFLPLFDGTPFKGLLWRLSGVRVGRMLFDDGAIIPEKTLVSIGDHATLNAGCVIQCHSLEDASFTSDAVAIGDGCTLGPSTFVHYGVRIGDRAVLDADSFLLKGERPGADTRWRGNPAAEVPAADLPDLPGLPDVPAPRRPLPIERPVPARRPRPARPVVSRPPGRAPAPRPPRTPRRRTATALATALATARALADRVSAAVAPGLRVIVIGALLAVAALQVGLAGSRLPAGGGEARLVDGAFAALRLPGATVLTGGLDGIAARAQLAGYAGLTGAFDRYPTVLTGARELAVVAVVVLLAGVVTLGWRLRVRPVALAAGLGLLVLTGPAVHALAVFGPGLLGAMWLVVGGALLIGDRWLTRALGVAAVVIGVLSAPVLAVPVAVAGAAAVGRRWAPRVCRGQRGPAAVLASVPLLVVLPWPGADAGRPALVAVLLALVVAVADELAGWLRRRPATVRRGLIGLAAAGWAGLAVTWAPDLRPAPPAPEPHLALAGWIDTAADPAATITAPPGVWSDLLRDGVPATRLVPDGALLVRSVASPAADLARFGAGNQALSITPARPPDVAADAAFRAAAGGQLAANRNLMTSPATRDAIRAGRVDARALIVLAGLTSQGPVTVTGLPASPGAAPGLPYHQVSLAPLDPTARAWLRAQRPPFAPVATSTTSGLTLVWPVPATPTDLAR